MIWNYLQAWIGTSHAFRVPSLHRVGSDHPDRSSGQAEEHR